MTGKDSFWGGNLWQQRKNGQLCLETHDSNIVKSKLLNAYGMKLLASAVYIGSKTSGYRGNEKAD